MDGHNVGELTSTGYSRKHGRVVAMGYVRTEAPMSETALVASRFEIDIAGVLSAVTPHIKLV
jgi:glycine cleavage system aminomethyltransferase T